MIDVSTMHAKVLDFFEFELITGQAAIADLSRGRLMRP